MQARWVRGGSRLTPLIAFVCLLAIVLAVQAYGVRVRPTPAAAPDEARQAAAVTAPEAPAAVAPAAPAAAAAPAAPSVQLAPAGPRGDVGAMGHVWQTFNNCGPAAVVMALSTLGVNASQEEARLALRGEDIRRGMPANNVNPWVASRFGLRAVVRTNGTSESVKRFVANGFPVVVTQWLEDPSRIAHYRVVRGYDDARGAFLVNDSMRGANVALGYAWFDANWQPFLYRYLVLYRPEDEPKVRALVGEDWDAMRMRERMYERARAEAASQQTAYAWLAYGEAAYQFGLFEEAVAAFERGFALGSAGGVFSVRSSYPLSLRLLGREEEARVVQARLANLTPVPANRTIEPDPLALEIAARRIATPLAAD
jgi:hypothetical protein